YDLSFFEAELIYYIVLFNVIAAFQTKHYLWAAFKAKEDKGDAIVEEERVNHFFFVRANLGTIFFQGISILIVSKCYLNGCFGCNCGILLTEWLMQHQLFVFCVINMKT
ncbi:hypothetical protein ACJX0J_039246, partial [Zea mays]